MSESGAVGSNPKSMCAFHLLKQLGTIGAKTEITMVGDGCVKKSTRKDLREVSLVVSCRQKGSFCTVGKQLGWNTWGGAEKQGSSAMTSFCKSLRNV